MTTTRELFGTPPADTTHECPANGCTRRVSSEMLACAPHWRRVPNATKLAVYRTFRRGRNLPPHIEAMARAIEEMNR